MLSMKIFRSVWALCALSLVACNPKQQPVEKINTFSNPILTGFYPDPGLVKAEGHYYLVTSSFSYFPGLPIFKSADLVNWEQIGHVMDRPEQLDTEGQGVSRGLFAPTIAFHEGTYYVTCTHIDRGGNFIVTAKNPEGPWSNPVYLPEVDGIDPSLFFDGDKMYIVYNSIPPDNISLYDGHRTIRMYEVNKSTLQVTGEQFLLVNGGVDLSKKPVWIEAPHLYKINDWYYLMCAEGGTADNHSEVIFRSKSVTGPFEPWDQNPILTQRHLDPERPFPVTTAGHADMVQTDNGEWWAVFLACRPYGDNFYNIGRETFIAPVKWTEDGWPIINPDTATVQYLQSTPGNAAVNPDLFPLSGNFTFRDEFDQPKLGFNYAFLRTPKTIWYQTGNGQLTLQLRPETAAGLSNPSFVAHRLQHHTGEVSTSLTFEAKAENEKAGLLAFQGENFHYLLCKSVSAGQSVVQLYRASEAGYELLAEQPVEADQVGLKMAFDKDLIRFEYQTGTEWQVLRDSVDATYLSTKVAGGFVGTMLAMYATSSDQPSDNSAAFDYLEYTGNDEVFRK